MGPSYKLGYVSLSRNLYIPYVRLSQNLYIPYVRLKPTFNIITPHRVRRCVCVCMRDLCMCVWCGETLSKLCYVFERVASLGETASLVKPVQKTLIKEKIMLRPRYKIELTRPVLFTDQTSLCP